MVRKPFKDATPLAGCISRVARIALLAIAAGAFFFGFLVTNASAQERSQRADPRADQRPRSNPGSSTGESVFAVNCSGCHGLDGQGSQRAPGISGNAKLQRLSDEQLAKIISGGVPGTGMPAFQVLGDEKVREVVGYLRVLEGERESRSLPGDANRGKEIFFGKGECSSCHSIYGAGGFLGQDLSAYGTGTSAQAILDAILTTDRIVPAGYRLGIVTTRRGDRFEGLIRNEDNFSLQLQTRDGSFHFFQKSDLQSVKLLSQSLMPTNYRQRLSPSELDDLVKYLVNGGISQKPTPVPPGDEEEDSQ
jgi:cytochrome c oxidase cbb3-type subunit III